jgi:hypothetical protein
MVDTYRRIAYYNSAKSQNPKTPWKPCPSGVKPATYGEGASVMATDTSAYAIVFPDWYDERRELETPAKGWLSGVEVHLDDGRRYGLTFYDPVRLAQTLEDDARSGQPYFAEPGLVVLPEVSTAAIQAAVPGLLRAGYFDSLKPLT